MNSLPANSHQRQSLKNYDDDDDCCIIGKNSPTPPKQSPSGQTRLRFRSFSEDHFKNMNQTTEFEIVQQKSYHDDSDFDTLISSGHRLCLTQTELQDFMIIEQKDANQDYQQLKHKDWNIIADQGLKGYNAVDIHVSLLTQQLNFVDRRKLWYSFCRIQNLKDAGCKDYPYQKIKKQKTIYEKQITLDASRTKLGPFFDSEDNQKSLMEILTAYAVYDDQLGYTQGMNYIVAQILKCYDMKENDRLLKKTEVVEHRDETCFYIFMHIMTTQNWRRLFLDGFPGLIIMIEKLKTRFRQEIPDLHAHFEKLEIELTIVFQHFYLTLLMYHIPCDFSRTILDLFLFEGEEFIHLMILGMLKYFKEKLLRKDFSELVTYCREQMLGEFYQIFIVGGNQRTLVSTLQRIGLIKCQEYEQEEPKTTLQKIKNYLTI